MAGFLQSLALEMLQRVKPLTHALAPPATDWRAQEMLLLSQVMRSAGSNLAPAAVLREMLHLMSELLGLNRGRIVLAPEGGAAAPSRIAHAYGLTADEVQRGRYAPFEGITGRVLLSGQPAIVQNIDAEPAFLFRAVPRERLPDETVAFLALPIAVGSRTAGVLACHSLRSRARRLGDDITLLKILATLAGQLLQLQRLAAAPAVVLPAPQPAPPRDYWSATSHPVQVLAEALRSHHGNRARAAQSLGLTPRQFGYRLQKLGLNAQLP